MEKTNSGKCNIYLIGMTGSGKTTVGLLLAKKLGCAFVDLDCEVERITRKTIPKLFEEKGESYFRRVETKALKKVSAHSGQVVALGGGACLSTENRNCIRRTGIAIYLKSSLGTLMSRLRHDYAGRPKLRASNLRELRRVIGSLARERRAHYLELAQLTVIVDKRRPGKVVSEIGRLLKK